MDPLDALLIMCTYEERMGRELKQEEVEAGTQKLKELLDAVDFEWAKEVKIYTEYSSYLENVLYITIQKVSINVQCFK